MRRGLIPRVTEGDAGVGLDEVRRQRRWTDVAVCSGKSDRCGCTSVLCHHAGDVLALGSEVERRRSGPYRRNRGPMCARWRVGRGRVVELAESADSPKPKGGGARSATWYAGCKQSVRGRGTAVGRGRLATRGRRRIIRCLSVGGRVKRFGRRDFLSLAYLRLRRLGRSVTTLVLVGPPHFPLRSVLTLQPSTQASAARAVSGTLHDTGNIHEIKVRKS